MNFGNDALPGSVGEAFTEVRDELVELAGDVAASGMLLLDLEGAGGRHRRRPPSADPGGHSARWVESKEGGKRAVRVESGEVVRALSGRDHIVTSTEGRLPL